MSIFICKDQLLKIYENFIKFLNVYYDYEGSRGLGEANQALYAVSTFFFLLAAAAKPRLDVFLKREKIRSDVPIAIMHENCCPPFLRG